VRAATGADDYKLFSDFRWTLLTHYEEVGDGATPMDARKPEPTLVSHGLNYNLID